MRYCVLRVLPVVILVCAAPLRVDAEQSSLPLPQEENRDLPFELPSLDGKQIATVVMNRVIIRSTLDFEDDEDIPVISGRGEGIMEEAPATGSGAARRNEDIALDLMKFVAMTTGYGRTASGGVGFSGSGSAAKPEDYADKLLELYGRCLGAVSGKK